MSIANRDFFQKNATIYWNKEKSQALSVSLGVQLRINKKRADLIPSADSHPEQGYKRGLTLEESISQDSKDVNPQAQFSLKKT